MIDQASEFDRILEEKRKKLKAQRENLAKIKSTPEAAPRPEHPEVNQAPPKFNYRNPKPRNVKSKNNWRANSRTNANPNIRDFTTNAYRNIRGVASDNTSLLQTFFGTIVEKIKRLSQSNLVADHPAPAAGTPITFNKNDWVLALICVLALGFIFTGETPAPATPTAETTTETTPAATAAGISQIHPRNISAPLQSMIAQNSLTFGEQKIMETINITAEVTAKQNCELYLSMLKQIGSDWYNQDTMQSANKKRYACNELLGR